jgi:hypothetical protein
MVSIRGGNGGQGLFTFFYGLLESVGGVVGGHLLLGEGLAGRGLELAGGSLFEGHCYFLEMKQGLQNSKALLLMA